MTLLALGAVALLAWIGWWRVVKDRREDAASRERVVRRIVERPDHYQ